MEKKCLYCGSDLVDRPSKTRYCDSTCRVSAHRKAKAITPLSAGQTALSADISTVKPIIEPLLPRTISRAVAYFEPKYEIEQPPAPPGENTMDFGLSEFQLALRKKRLGY